MTDTVVEPILSVSRAGVKRWKVNGKLHRLDGPALEYPDGTHAWYYYDVVHRADGPALRTQQKSYEWRYWNKLHRLLGPAVEYDNGRVEWWLEGKQLRFEEYIKHVPLIYQEERLALILQHG